MKRIICSGYRFPPAIIQQAIWLYLRFTLSLRDVEDLLAERGIAVSYESIRRWIVSGDWATRDSYDSCCGEGRRSRRRAWSACQPIATLRRDPRQQFVDAPHRPAFHELGQNVREVGLRFDVMEFARLNQRRDHAPVDAAFVVASEQAVLAIEGDGTDRSFDCQSASKRDPALPHLECY